MVREGIEPDEVRARCALFFLGGDSATDQTPPYSHTRVYGAVAGGLLGLLLCCPPPQLPKLPRLAEAVSASGPSIELDELEQPAVLSATSATRGEASAWLDLLLR
jgi:hypothetical protein